MTSVWLIMPPIDVFVWISGVSTEVFVWISGVSTEVFVTLSMAFTDKTPINDASSMIRNVVPIVGVYIWFTIL